LITVGISNNLKKEAADSSETPGPVCQVTQCHIPADHNLNIYHSDKFRLTQMSVNTVITFRKVLVLKRFKKNGMFAYNM